jgi:hypothetical protein
MRIPSGPQLVGRARFNNAGAACARLTILLWAVESARAIPPKVSASPTLRRMIGLRIQRFSEFNCLAFIEYLVDKS